MLSFSPDEDQRQLQDMLNKFATNEMRAIAHDCDENDEIPDNFLAKIWELGLIATPIPEQYGGYGQARSLVTGAIMSEELAYGDLSLALAALAPFLFVTPLIEMGTEEQKEKYLPGFCEESYKAGTMAVMEPRINFDPSNIMTTATSDQDGYVLNGQKCLVPLADRADNILVMAVSNNKTGFEAVEGFIVDKGTSGLKIGEREKNMGINALSTFPLTLENCKVPKENRLGGEKGIDFQRLINLSRITLSAMAVGICRAIREYAVNYAKERVQFGEPIASRQAIAFMLADMAIETDAMRLLTWKAAWKSDRGEDCTKEATYSKMFSSNYLKDITNNGIQVLGGHGYIREHPVELWFRNGNGFSAFEGLAII